MIDFTNLNVMVNFGLFALAAVIVWFAGARISRYADEISRKTGLGHAIVGLILLAGVTSLPEIGVSVASSAAGDEKLAVNNLLGSIAMQVAILAIIDFVIGRRALTSVMPEPAVMLQGALNVLLLAIAAAGIIVGDIAIFGVGAWAWACLAGYIGSVWLLSQARSRQPWVGRSHGAQDGEQRKESASVGQPLPSLLVRTGTAAVTILLAGYILSNAGSALAEQTGIGSSFIGFVLIAISTSLPEVSTALFAARAGFLTLAISDILGTNLINIGLIFLVDAVAVGDPVLNRVGSFSAFGALLGIMLTILYVAGLAERRDRTLWRMGYDSIAVLLIYAGGLIILYRLS